MSVVNESSRRAFLAALGASGAVAAVLPGVVSAEGGIVAPGDSITPTVSSGPTPLHTEAFPAATPGTNYTFVPGGNFQPVDNASAASFSKTNGQTETTNGTWYLPVDHLPHGARITEVTFAVVKSAVYPGSAIYSAFVMTSGAVTFITSAQNNVLPQQTAEQYANLTVDPTDLRWIVDNQQGAMIWLVAQMVNSRLNSVRVGWVPGPTTPLSFFPIAPTRAYDSRSITPIGPLPNNASRVVSVANGYSTATSTLETPNIIPVGAQAIAYNITIANTVGSGFLSVNPGDATVPGGSSINWFTSGLSLANGLVVKLDANRQINVFCGGGGTTDFIIDILGYYA